MGKYYTIRHREGKDKGYEVHGDVIIPSMRREYFTDYGIEGAIKALKKIGKERGIERRMYFESSSNSKRKKALKSRKR